MCNNHTYKLLEEAKITNSYQYHHIPVPYAMKIQICRTEVKRSHNMNTLSISAGSLMKYKANISVLLSRNYIQAYKTKTCT